MAFTALYPPIVSTYMPAFAVSNGKGTARIYFSLSPYNNDYQLQSILVSIVNPYTNLSVVDKEKYKSELIHFSYKNDVKIEQTSTGDKKYIEINESHLSEANWDTSLTYKVQLRFCDQVINNTNNNMGWISSTSMTGSFSEWSSFCLLQPIIPPTINLINFPEDTTQGVWNE